MACFTVPVIALKGNPGFRFCIVGDRNGGAVAGIFEATIDEVKLFRPDFVINVGDLIPGYDPDTNNINSQWDTIMNIVHGIPCKFYFVPGNHDIQNENDRRLFKNRTGCNRYYSFDYSGSHFIVLDNTMTQWITPEDIDEEQFVWLEADLKKNQTADNIFVFFHVPTYLESFLSGKADPLVELLEKYGVRTVFSGHIHSYEYNLRSAVEYIVVGSSGGSMDNTDFARGDFYQFLFITVNAKEHDIAVIREGNVFPVNVVTGDDYLAITRADTGAVKYDECLVREGAKKFIQDRVLTISNLGPDSLSQPLTWIFDTLLYDIKPAAIPLALGPDDKREHAVNFKVRDGSRVFPLPRFILAYPFTYGKTCTLRNTLGVKRLKSVVRLKTPPVIDGKLDDGAWKKVVPITDFGTYDGAAVSPVEKTEVLLGHDEENLYIGVRCYDSDMAAMITRATENDGATYVDDNIWFFFDPDLDQETYLQAIINANAAVFDRQCRAKDGNITKDLAWNGPWEVKSGKGDNYWTLEMRIPKQGLAPDNEKRWGFAIRRLQNRIGDAYWNVPFGHDPRHFGIIEFE